MEREEDLESTYVSRRRGRPRKESVNGRQQEKRERARQIQKNFHLRKKADSTLLRDRVTLLEEAVEGMSREFASFGGRVFNTTNSPSQSQILDDIRRTTERFLEIARNTEPLSSLDEREPSPDMPSTTALDPQPISMVREWPEPVLELPIMSATSSHSATGNSLHFTVPAKIWPRHEFNSAPATSGMFSPRLSYGILAPSLFNTAVTETVWSQYLIAGPNSFAMRLYMDVCGLVLKLLRHGIVNGGILLKVCRYRFRHEQPGRLLGLLIDQLRMMDPSNRMASGVGRSSHNPLHSQLVLFGPSDPLMSHPLRQQIYEDVTRDMGSVKGWLDPWSTQEYLRGKWGIYLTSFSAQISVQSLEPFNSQVSEIDYQSLVGLFSKQATNDSRNQSSVRQDFIDSSSYVNISEGAQSLIDILTEEAVCFGEGPRFHQDSIDKAAIKTYQRLILQSKS